MIYKMKLKISTLFAIILFSWSISLSEGKSPYSILHDIKSPQELVFPYFPEKFCVPVKLSGSIAEEMYSTIRALNIDTPSYVESFNGKEFDLFIADESLPEQTRDLLSGILNPLEIIDLIVQSLVKYKSDKLYRELTEETNFSIVSTNNNSNLLQIKLSPKGNRFSYTYEDNGAFIHESWMTEMNITIDTSSHLVYEIDTKKMLRQFSIDAIKSPPLDSLSVKYCIDYSTIENKKFPIHLQIFTDNIPTLSIGVTYRHNGKWIVFDKKTISSTYDSKTSDLKIQYGNYSFNLCDVKRSSSTQINHKLIAASTLSKKAVDYLRKGNIKASTHVLREIAQKYDGTPQAIEANRLLAHLPTNLR